MPDHTLPTGRTLSREEVAHIEVGHTSVGRGTAQSLVLGFLVLIAVPPLVDAGCRAAGGTEASTAWPVLRNVPVEASVQFGSGPGTLVDAIVGANRAVLAGLHAFEDALEDEAVPAVALRPGAQQLLTGWFGVGNERVYTGRDGWLFYRPDVEYATGPGFLDRSRHARRIASAREWVERPHPDPRPALVQFHRQLEDRGIVLIVMPTPVKPSVHPEQLARGVAGAVENPSYGEFVAELGRQGVVVFDTWRVLADERSRSEGDPLYLATDTHWRPRTMERVAAALGHAIRDAAHLPPVPDPGYIWQRQSVIQAGDTAVMLDLPEGTALYPPETVDLRRVVAPGGTPWRPSRGADILVLGDSFANIYSLGSMGWGDSAGLVEHLSLALGRPVDRLVQNDEGAFATRARLRQELASDPGRLAGTRVVVYQFAARELSIGDWRPISLPPPAGP
jgi:hypothetical protein